MSLLLLHQEATTLRQLHESTPHPQQDDEQQQQQQQRQQQQQVSDEVLAALVDLVEDLEPCCHYSRVNGRQQQRLQRLLHQHLQLFRKRQHLQSAVQQHRLFVERREVALEHDLLVKQHKELLLLLERERERLTL